MNLHRADTLRLTSRKFKDPQLFLANQLARATTSFDAAHVILAMALDGGPYKAVPALALHQTALRTVEAFLDTRQREETPQMEGGHLCQNYEIIPPSDEARKQRREWNEKRGMTHVGTRMVGLKPKQTVRRYSEELPRHWTI